MKSLFLAYEILSPINRKRFWVVLSVSIIGMAFEVAGISLLMPMIDLLVNPERAGDFPLWQAFLSYMGDGSNILVLGLAFVVGFFALKNLFLAYQVNLHSKYSFGVQVETSTYLFDDYLARPYKFFLKTNTAELLRNAVGEVNSFVGYVLQPILVIITECLVLCAIIALLVFVEPQASLLAIVFVGGLGWAFHRFTKQRVLEWGKERQRREGMKIKCLQEGFTGIKALKLLDDHALLSESFREHTQMGAVAGRKQYAMQQIPRLLLETLAILGLALLTLASVYFGEGGTASLPKLGMIVFGLVRLMPSVARIVHSCQSVVYGWPCVDVLKAEIGDWKLTCSDSEAKAECSFDESFELDDVSFAYSGSSEKSMNNATIKVRKGLSVGIIGESGSGKSTLVDIALGLLEPDEGRILVDGKKIGEEVSRSSWQRMVGYVPQEIFMADDTLMNNVALGMDPRKVSEDRVLKCIEEASLASVVKELPLGLDTMMGERGTRFSGGQKQRVGIARALYHDPSFIVFDEATSSLDSETEQGVMQTVRDLQKTKTFLIVAHRLSTLKDCDLIYRIRDGRVVGSGSFNEMTEV